MRAPPPRITNLALLVALVVAFASGVGAVAAGTTSGRWVAVAHGIVGVAVVLLVPWKSMIVRRGLRRARRSRWASLVLAALAVTALITGLGSASGLLRSVGGFRGIWLHVAAALALVPLVVWHVFARPAHATGWTCPGAPCFGRARSAWPPPASTSPSPRWSAPPGCRAPAAASPAPTRSARSTRPRCRPRAGSTTWHPRSTRPPGVWSYADADGERELSLEELSRYDARLRATLDCTSGWYSHQDWEGVPVAALVRNTGAAQSLHVHSSTGYWIRFPIGDLDRLLLATRAGGAPLSVGHGFPARLVAPGRRGFWWVKWVDRIELRSTPWWWQPPFPVT